MGWPTVAVYDGGWLEWSRNPGENPIEIGEPVRSGRLKPADDELRARAPARAAVSAT